MNVERIIQLVDAYNLYAVRANTAASAESTANIDRRTRELVQQSDATVRRLESLLDEQTLTNELLDHNLRVAVAQYKELRSISNELSGMAADFKEVTAHLRERARRDSRDEALKELLYSSELYQNSFSEEDDQTAKAYGALLLRRLIKNNEFGSKDLSTIVDKRYFDQRIAENDAVRWETPPEIFQQLDRLEKAYALYPELQSTDVTAHLPRKRELRSVTESESQIEYHIWRTHGPRTVKVFDEEDIEKAEKLLGDFPDFIGERISKPSLGFFERLGLKKSASEAPSPFPRGDAHLGWTLAQALVYPGYIHCYPPFEDQKYFFGVWYLHPEWRDALSRIVDDHKEFAKRAPDLIEQYVRGLPKYNADAEACNRQLEEQERVLRQKHEAIKKDLMEYINNFLSAHPAIRQYLPSV